MWNSNSLQWLILGSFKPFGGRKSVQVQNLVIKLQLFHIGELFQTQILSQYMWILNCRECSENQDGREFYFYGSFPAFAGGFAYDASPCSQQIGEMQPIQHLNLAALQFRFDSTLTDHREARPPLLQTLWLKSQRIFFHHRWMCRFFIPCCKCLIFHPYFAGGW